MFDRAWLLVHRNLRRYARPMADLGAGEVAAEIRQRLPGVGVKKLHKLLYYCQAHHVAALGEPMFAEAISAWDMGPVVGALWHREQASPDSPEPVSSGGLGEPELNTIGYVLSRYGKLTGLDLERLTHSEDPWIEPRVAAVRHHVDLHAHGRPISRRRAPGPTSPQTFGGA